MVWKTVMISKNAKKSTDIKRPDFKGGGGLVVTLPESRIFHGARIIRENTWIYTIDLFFFFLLSS